jgi:hypothetical protein
MDNKKNVGRMNFDCLLVPDLNLFLYISVNSSFLLEKTKIKIFGTCIQFYPFDLHLVIINGVAAIARRAIPNNGL